MSTENGGEHEHLAPVIPLFGGPAPVRPGNGGGEFEKRTVDPFAPDEDPVVEAAFAELKEVIDRARDRERAAATDSPSWDADARSGTSIAAPVDGESVSDPRWHPTWAADRRGFLEEDDAAATPDVDLAEKALLKKLRTRSLSVSEARGVLREFDLDAAATEHVIASMDEYGYLDDAALADQLIHAGVDRKGQGRQVIAQTLAKRGIPRDIADAALASLPDDDFERALEFARGKARSLRSLDRETALRRLTGQLARRGYGGSIASSAARAALDENPGGSSGVRFR